MVVLALRTPPALYVDDWRLSCSFIIHTAHHVDPQREQPLNINEEIAPSVVKSSSIEDTDPGTDEPNPADEVNPDEEDGDDDEGVDPSIAIGDSRAEDTVLSALDSGGPAPSRTLKAKPRRQTADALRVQKLGRQLNQSRKINSELRNQLQQLYRNDAIAQVGGNSTGVFAISNRQLY